MPGARLDEPFEMLHAHRVLDHIVHARVAALLVHPADVLLELEPKLVRAHDLQMADPQPLWRAVEHQGAAWLEHTHRLGEPCARPLHIVRHGVPHRLAHADIVRRVRDHQVHGRVCELLHALDAVAMRDREVGLVHIWRGVLGRVDGRAHKRRLRLRGLLVHALRKALRLGRRLLGAQLAGCCCRHGCSRVGVDVHRLRVHKRRRMLRPIRLADPRVRRDG